MTFTRTCADGEMVRPGPAAAPHTREPDPSDMRQVGACRAPRSYHAAIRRSRPVHAYTIIVNLCHGGTPLLGILGLHDACRPCGLAQPAVALIGLATLLSSERTCADPMHDTHACIDDPHVEAAKRPHSARSGRVVVVLHGLAR